MKFLLFLLAFQVEPKVRPFHVYFHDVTSVTVPHTAHKFKHPWGVCSEGNRSLIEIPSYPRVEANDDITFAWEKKHSGVCTIIPLVF